LFFSVITAPILEVTRINCTIRNMLTARERISLQTWSWMYGTVYLLLQTLTHLQPLRGLLYVQICLHSCCVIVLDVFFLLLLFLISYIRHVSRVFLPYYCFMDNCQCKNSCVGAPTLWAKKNWNWRELFILRPVGLEDWIDTITYDTIRDAILTCAQKLTYVSLIHRAYRRITKPPCLFRRVSSRITYNVFSWRRQVLVDRSVGSDQRL